MAKTLAQGRLATPGRPWTPEEDRVIYEERREGNRSWARIAADRLPGRTPVMCWSRDKTMRDREALGEVVAYRFDSTPWCSNPIHEDDHVAHLNALGGFPRELELRRRPGGHLITVSSILLDQEGRRWNPA